MYCILLFNNDGYKLPTFGDYMSVVPPGTCPYGYLSRGKLSGGKLSASHSLSTVHLANKRFQICLPLFKDETVDGEGCRLSMLEVEDGNCAAHGKLYTALALVSLATKNHNLSQQSH